MQVNTVYGALAYLSGQCDGAQDRDGVGFSGSDSDFGKDLARKAAVYGLSEKQHACGKKFAHKYRKQLRAAGFDLDAIEAEAWAPSERPQATPAARAYVKPTKPIDGFPNRFAGRCGCGTKVEVGHGRCTKQGGRWITYCAECSEPTREADIAASVEQARQAVAAVEPMVRIRVVDGFGHDLSGQLPA
jgi:hypothetical protein